ncbi:hypothetical protein QR680_018666 [Steinernema hermaphroditum]|uniref:Saposin B-type domain-containing protein n=1 Tax=Steinernema hermaphroditum TaxID=289476 RepID=A0AA39LRD3_9BILA|nr:hypothetical protein QR680_018666 [Steinernema hermaphroditum]
MSYLTIAIFVAVLGLATATTTELNNELFCKICQDLVEKGEQSAQNAGPWLRENTGKICGRFRTDFGQGLCKAFLDIVAKRLEESVCNQIPPKEACQKMKFC